MDKRLSNTLQEKITTLPDKPGVYLHKDTNNNVIYVGKASSLKNRVRHYFQSPKSMETKLRALVSHIADFEYIVTGNEIEALILENTLIKKYMPKYNVLLRDDKTFPYIKITMGEEFPRLVKTRVISNDGSKYFGPYADVKSVNVMIDLLNDVFKLKRCSTTNFPKGFKPCLNGHIDKCRKVCQCQVDRDEYMEAINAIIAFLKGQDKGVVNYLKEKMNKAASDMDYETAARYRDYIVSADSIIKKQRVELLSTGDMDILLASDVVKSPSDSNITVFFVRNGKLSGREVHRAHKPEGETNSEIVAAFLKQYYSAQSMIPKEIILEEHIQDEETVSQFLSDIQGRKVKIIVPERGQKRDLLKLAQKDIAESIRVQKVQKDKEDSVDRELGSEFTQLLDIDAKERPLTLEAYDISHTGGTDSVGAMVVFEGQKPAKKRYRRFKIRSEDGADDYSSMQEVLYRRLRRGLENDPAFTPMPDLILIDGGLGHVNAVKPVLTGLKVDIPVVGMVKDDKHRTRGLIINEKELNLEDFPRVGRLIGNIQEEVHRFVIEYHRGVRNKSSLTSELDNIPDIGPKRRMRLMSAFGSIDKIKEASIDELKDIDGMSEKAAEQIKTYFSKKEEADHNEP